MSLFSSSPELSIRVIRVGPVYPNCPTLLNCCTYMWTRTFVECFLRDARLNDKLALVRVWSKLPRGFHTTKYSIWRWVKIGVYLILLLCFSFPTNLPTGLSTNFDPGSSNPRALVSALLECFLVQKSDRSDGTHPQLLKTLATFLAGPLTSLFNNNWKYTVWLANHCNGIDSHGRLEAWLRQLYACELNSY